MTTDRIELEGGKYTYIQHQDGRSEALRYNEPWRDLTGDNLVSAMASRIEELTEQGTEPFGWLKKDLFIVGDIWDHLKPDYRPLYAHPDPIIDDLTAQLADMTKERDALAALVNEACRAIGNHYPPDDCYSTGPLTGNDHRDLVECPACFFIAMHAAIAATKEPK